jgi:3-oxoacyl-[acyl-carrier protein] reductase
MTDAATGDLSGRVALVAGGAGMIGSAIARRLAQRHAVVVCADRAFDREIVAGADCRQVDLGNPARISRLVDDIVERYGRLDCLVCAAGVTSFGNFQDITVEEWDRVHAINLRGLFFLLQAAAVPMRAAGYGRIVTIGSVLAKNGGNPRPWLDRDEQRRASNAAYGAAKAGVHALTLFLAKELAADGITVNAVAPGPIASAMTTKFPQVLVDQIPVGRLGTADEVASAVVWLCGEESSFVTGDILVVNGGLWMD